MKNKQYHDSVQVRLVSRRLQSETQEELSPSLHYGDASRDALLPSPKRSGRKLPCAASGIPSVLDRAFKGEL